MKIAVVGTGYVGLANAVLLAQHNTVYAVDDIVPAKLVGSCEKAREMLGWNPVYGDIDTIVSHAWQWHQNAGY